MNPKYDSICIDMAKLIKNLGPLGAQKVAEKLAVQADEKQIRKLIQCFLHFETDAIDYAPMVMKLISERLGKELSEDQFETLLICFDALVAVNPNSEEVFDLGKSCIDYDFWNEDSLPFVASYENKGHQIVRDRLRKKACNILGWIGGKRSIEILADQGAKENLRGNNPLANIFTWTGAYVETYGSLRHDYEIRINALG